MSTTTNTITHLPTPSSPSSSQTPQSSDNSSRLQSLFRSRTFILKLILLSCSLLVFCISLMFAIEHWGDHQSNSPAKWTSQTCTVISRQIQKDSSDPSRFRITAIVTGLSSSNRRDTAYYGPTSGYELSHQQAQAALVDIQPGKNTTCYVSSQPTRHVSLLEPPAQSRPNSVSVAWTTTSIAAITAVILLTFLSHSLHSFMSSRLPSPLTHLATPRQAKTPFLTSRQTTFVCQNYAHDLHPSKKDDWVCSICLEEDPNDSVIKSVRLPCHHTYHQRCIREWLRKGKSVCPLCNWNVKSVFERTPVCENESEQQLQASDGLATTSSISRTEVSGSETCREDT